ncbi:MAG: hypothetical protein HRU01_23915 [Myxococcales bacterium]|nr:hypothetical protein [Myxococcales bacterium]
MECQDNELGWLHTQVTPSSPGPFSNFEPFSVYYFGIEYGADPSMVWRESFADGATNPGLLAKAQEPQHHGGGLACARGRCHPRATTGLLLAMGLVGLGMWRRRVS